MKQTVVDWLIEQWPILESQLPPWLIEQAKAMEKEQLAHAYKRGQKHKKPLKDSNPITFKSE